MLYGKYSTTRFVVGRRDGEPESAGQPERGAYADWFTVMGLAELARTAGEQGWLDATAPILERSRADPLDQVVALPVKAPPTSAAT